MAVTVTKPTRAELVGERAGAGVADYRVVSAQSGDELRQKVRRLLDKGWEPLGGVCATVLMTADGIIHQAMIHHGGDGTCRYRR